MWLLDIPFQVCDNATVSGKAKLFGDTVVLVLVFSRGLLQMFTKLGECNAISGEQ